MAIVWLVICGLLLQWSVVMYKSLIYNVSPISFALNNILRLFLGFLAFFAGMWLFNKRIDRYADTILYVSIGLLILTLIYGRAFGGATRWIEFLGFSFQPSEFVKFALIMYLGKVYYYEGLGKVSRVFWKSMIITLVVALLIGLQPNISTAITMSLSVFLILWFLGAKIFQILTSSGILLILFYIAYNTFPHVRERIDIYLGKSDNPKVAQVVQSKVAILSGGVFGRGPGKGLQKLGYLPSSDKDFAFSYITEEYGILGFPGGALWIMIMILIITWNGLWASSKIEDEYKKFLVFGFSLMFFIFSYVHIMVNIGILPPTGLPLPFVSYGGSSLVSSSFAVGYILRGIMEGY